MTTFSRSLARNTDEKQNNIVHKCWYGSDSKYNSNTAN